MNTRILNGDIAELNVALECIKRGFNVSIPFSKSLKYDLVIDMSGVLIRCQIKKIYNTKINNKVYNCIETRKTSGKVKSEYYKGDFDYLIACDITKNDFWIFPEKIILQYSGQIYLDTDSNIIYKNNWEIL